MGKVPWRYNYVYQTWLYFKSNFHENIKFTHKLEDNGQISLLDVPVIKRNDNIINKGLPLTDKQWCSLH